MLHGCDQDVLWLQRDFGLYLVNVFDTGLYLLFPSPPFFPQIPFSFLFLSFLPFLLSFFYPFVNYFFSGQASRVLEFPYFSLAYLLKFYCNVTADKQYQVADWRIRPLPPPMVLYAQQVL